MGSTIASLFGGKLRAINVGLALFGESLREQGVDVVEVDWRPPAGGDMDLVQLLDEIGQGNEGDSVNGE